MASAVDYAFHYEPMTECFEHPLGHGWRKRLSHGLNAAWVDLEKKIITTPGGASIYDRFVRWHELMHIRITEGTPLALAERGRCSVEMIQVTEDLRVNYWLTRAGFDLSAGCAPPETLRVATQRVLARERFDDLCCMLVATSLTGSRAVIAAELLATHGRVLRQCREILRIADRAVAMLRARERPTIDDMLRTARWLESMLRKWKRRPEESPDSNSPANPFDPSANASGWPRPGGTSGPRGANRRESPDPNMSWGPPLNLFQEDIPEGLAPPGDASYGAMPSPRRGKRPSLQDLQWRPTKVGEPVWGEMEIQEPPLTIPCARGWKPRWRASAEGTQARFPYRALIDQRPFALRKRERGGTVLIDCSGSMKLSVEDVECIVEHAPGATIAVYGGTGASGILRIVADRGWLADTAALTDGFGKGNIVDGPALEWLATMPRPRLWIADALVTGAHEVNSELLRADAQRICAAADIIRLPSVPNAVAYFTCPSDPSTQRHRGANAILVDIEEHLSCA